MTPSQENLEDRLRRVLHEQAQELQVHPAEWQEAPRAVADRRPRRLPPFGGLAVGFGSAIAILVAIGALVLVGHHNAGTKAGAGVPIGARTVTTPSGPPDCNAAGINAQQLREGTCVDGPMTVVVVNKTSTLHLKSLDANYAGFHTQNSLRDSTGVGTATANGKFAILTITIKNTLRAPQQWQPSMAALFIPTTSTGSGNSYSEDFNAESGADQNSCLWKTGSAAHGGLQPGASVTCDVVFDIPASADPAARGSGLDIANFGEDVSNPSRQPVGIIRTYH
jgi:Domain of unknown function (DUF4352)